MADVFVNYGSSTKRDTDELTGGFGLGAKTPFSYTDNFTIETIVDGIKYSYVAAIEEGSKGKIYCIDTTESVEHSGTTIIIPIKQQDRRTFEDEVYRATIFWDMKPIYKNFSRSIENITLNKKINSEDFLVVEQNLMSSGYGLLLDGIYYPINYTQMSFASNYVSGHLVIFKFNISELTISANRETLQYDEKTKTAINKKYSALMSHCMIEYEKLHNSSKTWLEALINKRNRVTNIFYKIIDEQLKHNDPYREKISSFKGRALSSKLDTHFQTLAFYEVELTDNKVSRSKVTEVKAEFGKMPFYFFNETASFIPLKDATILTNEKQYIAIRPIDSTYLKFSSLSYKAKKLFAKRMRMFLNEIELLKELGFSYNLYSNVPRAKVDKSNVNVKIPGVNRKPDTLKVFIKRVDGMRHEGSFTYVKTNGTEITYESRTPLEKEKFVLVLVDDILKLPTFKEEFEMLTIAIRAKLLPEFALIYANKKRGAKLKGLISENWKERVDAVTPDIISHIIDTDNIKTLIHSNSWTLSLTFVSKKFSSLIESLKSYDIKTHYEVPGYLQTKYKNMSKVGNLNEQYNDIFKTFPLLNRMYDYNINNYIKDINQYVNLVENDLISKKQLV